MTKTFTCRELGGICDEKFSGDTLMEVMEQGMQHMQSDDAHKEHIAGLAQSSGENKDQWFERMQKEFEARSEDNG